MDEQALCRARMVRGITPFKGTSTVSGGSHIGDGGGGRTLRATPYLQPLGGVASSYSSRSSSALDLRNVRNIESAARAIDAEFHKHAGEINAHAAAINELTRKVEGVHYHQQLDAYKETVRESFKDALSYSNVVMGVGYAGFFALWSLVKGDLTPLLHASAAMLVAVSLLGFVGWEVYRMASMALLASDIERKLDDSEDRDGLRSGLADMTAAQHRHRAKFARYWPMSLAFTLAPAVGGGLLLFYGLARHLFAIGAGAN